MPLIFIILTLFFTDSEPAKPKMKPPGTIKVEELYFDVTEILNIHWTEYLKYLNAELDSVQEVIPKPEPDSINYQFVNRSKRNSTDSEFSWMKYYPPEDFNFESDKLKPFIPDSTNFWYKNPNRKFQPVTNISYEQAVDFCVWRSKVVSRKYGRKVNYRLPTNEEWSTVAKYLLDNQYKATTKDFRLMKKNIELNQNKYYLMVINGFKSDIIHMFDNVSEMTSEKGTAMGANNLELIGLEDNLTKIYHYKKPNSYLGFRCVAEYVD